MSYHRVIPENWKRNYWGVLETYTSPSGNEWIRLAIGGWDWYYNGKEGFGETQSDCLKQMAKLGMIEGEFE